MIYIAIAFAQTIDPWRIALVVLCMAMIWKTVAPRRRLLALAISLVIIAAIWSANIEIARIIGGSPLPRDFASEAVIFLTVTIAGLFANSVIAAVAWGCGKLLDIVYRRAWQL